MSSFAGFASTLAPEQFKLHVDYGVPIVSEEKEEPEVVVYANACWSP
jgi:hypothetical protein